MNIAATQLKRVLLKRTIVQTEKHISFARVALSMNKQIRNFSSNEAYAKRLREIREAIRQTDEGITNKDKKESQKREEFDKGKDYRQNVVEADGGEVNEEV